MKLCVTGSIIRFFADDTRILRHIYSLADVEILQHDLNCVVKWAKCNNMALHEDKFELLVHKHCPQNTLLDHPFAILTQVYQVSDGNMLYPSKMVKDLGVMVSADLSWSPHVTLIAERARKVAAWVLSAFKTRNKVTMLTLYKSLIRSHLEYFQECRHPTTGRGSAYVHNENRCHTASKLLAETQGLEFDVVATEERTVYHHPHVESAARQVPK